MDVSIMNVVMYFHHNQFPTPQQHSWKYRCGTCGKFLFKANTQNIVVSNDIGIGWESYEPSQSLIEIRCHSCKSTYKILFQ